MRLGIMQPYFMPYIGYLSLVKHTDVFILFDTVQFIRHGWIERNRILKPGEGWQHIAVPLVKAPREATIKERMINDSQPWRDKLRAKLTHYKKAPFYSAVMLVIDKAISVDCGDITHMDAHCLRAIDEYLGIDTPIQILSEMDITVAEASAPDEWALNICRAIPDANEYWNPPGGMSFFDRDKYIANDIDLRFLMVNSPQYSQRREEFVPDLSIIDVMMFNSPEAINEMMDDYELL